MEVPLTPEQYAQLAEMAIHAGTDPEHLVAKMVLRYLDDDARLLAGIKRGLEAAKRGEFVDDEEMDARFEAMIDG